MTGSLHDLRFALRQLVRSPGFSLTAVVSLIFGIAATAAVFSVVWGLAMNPYPYAAPDRMMHLRLQRDKPGNFQEFGVTGTQWQQFRNAAPIEDAVIIDGWN